jgi:4-hydroxybutyrate CoA-transferase
MDTLENWKERAESAEVAVGRIRSGMKIYLHGGAATPIPLEEAMCRLDDVEGVELYHIHKDGPAPFTEPNQAGRFHSNSFFCGANTRAAIAEGRADFIPIFLSDIPHLFKSRQVKLDAAMVSLSPPDRHGFCSLGPSVEAALAAVNAAPLVIAEINHQMPRTHGDSFVHINDVQHFILADRPLVYQEKPKIGEVERSIGAQIAEMIEDGSTLQLGIGGIPAAVVELLGNKVDLGVHTEMFSDGVMDLMEAGVINNRRKSINNGHTVTSFVTGTRALFSFIDDNPEVEFHPCDYTNDTNIIRQIRRMVAVNSALEIDLSGQVCADSIGHRIYSGIGGQMDFIRGAAQAPEGKPIIALPSTAKNGTMSRIVPCLKPGAGVVTTRGHVHWVVTEHGAVNLHGRTLQQRGEDLISIAHPDFRSELKKSFKEQRHFPTS